MRPRDGGERAETRILPGDDLTERPAGAGHVRQDAHEGDQVRLEALGQEAYVTAYAGNVVFPEPIPEGERSEFGASDQQSAVDVLAGLHPGDKHARDLAEALVYSF